MHEHVQWCLGVYAMCVCVCVHDCSVNDKMRIAARFLVREVYLQGQCRKLVKKPWPYNPKY